MMLITRFINSKCYHYFKCFILLKVWHSVFVCIFGSWLLDSVYITLFTFYEYI